MLAFVNNTPTFASLLIRHQYLGVVAVHPYLRQNPLQRRVWRSFSKASVLSDDLMSGQDLFQYTSGRWIWNNALRHSEKQREFNVSELIKLAAASVQQDVEAVTHFEKFAEGGFNRTFLLTMRDGSELIARVPYPMVEPRNLVVASEVATMTYLRSNGLPVPKIFGYSTTPDNAAGTEYTIMERVRGINLGDVWFDMPEKARLTVISNLVALEARLFDLSLPASGSVYYAKDLSAEHKKIDIPNTEFCLGPDTSVHMWHGRRVDLAVDRGPFADVHAALSAAAEKEIAYLTKFGRPLLPIQRLRRETFGYQEQSHLDQLRNLEKYLATVPHLAHQKNSTLKRHTIRHPDLNPNNIIVSDSLEIMGLIDWQHCVVLPLVLQQGIPHSFQNYGDEVSESLKLPNLPEHLETLSEEEQLQEVLLYRRRQIHHCYVTKTAEMNPSHYDALTDHSGTLTRKLFNHAGIPWEGDNTTLRADLIQLTKEWSNHCPMDLREQVPCPISFSADEEATCLRLSAAQTEADALFEAARNVIGAGAEGWVPVEQYEDAMQRAEQLKADALQDVESDDEREMIRRHWVFDDFNEEDYL